MTVSSDIATAQFGGYPLLDMSFQPARLLAAVGCVRWHRARVGGLDLQGSQVTDMLDPEIALSVRRLDLELSIDWVPLDANQAAQIRSALDLVCSSIPAWGELMHLPIALGQAPEKWRCVSASVFAWPQHIWLAPAAFATSAGLAEQLVHEISHQWMYFIEEMSPLHNGDFSIRLTLPSGTPDRTIGELIGALHVSRNLQRLWRAMP